MTLIFIDGFDLYGGSGDFSRRWDASNMSDYTKTGGRYGGRAGTNAGFSNSWCLAKTIPEMGDDSSNKVVASMAVMYTSPNTNDTGARMIAFGPAINTDLSQSHIGICQDTGGKLKLMLGGTAISGAATSSQVLFANTWHRVELEVYLHATAGTARVAVDGTTVIDYTGNTINTGLSDAKIRAVMIGRYGASSVGTTYWDDVAIWGTGGTGPSGFIGDFIVNTIFPTANGDHTSGTATGAASLYDCVDDTDASNGDTDYVLNTTVGDTTSFQMADLTTLGTIYGVAVVASQRASAPGLRKADLGVRVSSTDHWGSDRSVPSQSTYTCNQEIFQNNPGTSAAWTLSDVNAVQAAYKLAS